MNGTDIDANALLAANQQLTSYPPVQPLVLPSPARSPRMAPNSQITQMIKLRSQFTGIKLKELLFSNFNTVPQISEFNCCCCIGNIKTYKSMNFPSTSLNWFTSNDVDSLNFIFLFRFYLDFLRKNEFVSKIVK